MENRIKELRKKRGLSQEQLGDAIGSHFTTIAKLEKGEQRLSLEYMYPIAEALGCHARDLIPGPETDYHEPLVPVVGEIEKDRWMPPKEDNEAEPNQIAVARHQAYRSVEHVAYKVGRPGEGDEPPVDTYLVCIPIEKARSEDLALADAVVERRHKHLMAIEVRKVRAGVLDPPTDDIESDDQIKGIVVVTVEPLKATAGL